MRDRTFIIGIACLVAVVMAGYVLSLATGRTFSKIDFGLNPVAPRGTLKAVERRIRQPRLNRYVRGVYQARVQDFLRREFVGFDSVLLGYSQATSTANLAFYRTLLRSQPIAPVGVDTSSIFQDVDTGALIQVSLAKSTILTTARTNARDASALAERFPVVSFNYYGIPEWTSTPTARNAGYRDPSDEAWGIFRASVSNSVTTGGYDVTDWGTRFYRTDHHLTPVGAYQGYRDIVAMLARSNPAVAQHILPFGERTIEGVRFLGTSARRAAYVVDPEPFRINTSHEPLLKAYKGGLPAPQIISNTEYLKSPSDELFASQYGDYNGPGIAEFVMRNGAKPGTGNLLVFGDSFNHVLDDMEASHFDTTYFIDLRNYRAVKGKPFDLAGYLTEHDIKTVLFVGRHTRVMSMPTAIVNGKSIL